MGDNIDEGVWEGEDEVNLADYAEASASDYESGSDSSGLDDGDGEATGKQGKLEEKVLTGKEKRKLKFAEMKEKKRRVLAAVATAEGGDAEPDGTAAAAGAVTAVKGDKAAVSQQQEVAPQQMSVEEQLEALMDNAPHEFPLVDSDGALKLDASCFFYPDFCEGENVQVSKNHCAFVRALSVSLPSYRKMILNINNYSASDYGCPILLIVCASALRCTEIVKSVSSKIPKCKIAKLFAKHIKAEEQMDLLSKSYYPIAIGTPNRVAKLIELGALSLTKVKILLCDVTQNVKKMSLLTQPGVKDDLYKLLTEQVRADKNHMKIALVSGSGSSSR